MTLDVELKVLPFAIYSGRAVHQNGLSGSFAQINVRRQSEVNTRFRFLLSCCIDSSCTKFEAMNVADCNLADDVFSTSICKTWAKNETAETIDEGVTVAQERLDVKHKDMFSNYACMFIDETRSPDGVSELIATVYDFDNNYNYGDGITLATEVVTFSHYNYAAFPLTTVNEGSGQGTQPTIAMDCKCQYYTNAGVPNPLSAQCDDQDGNRAPLSTGQGCQVGSAAQFCRRSPGWPNAPYPGLPRACTGPYEWRNGARYFTADRTIVESAPGSGDFGPKETACVQGNLQIGCCLEVKTTE